MLAFVCPKCLTTLKAPEDEAGASIECQHCGRPVRVPGGPAADRRSGEDAAAGGRQWLPPLPVLIVAGVVVFVFGLAACGGVAFLALSHKAAKQAAAAKPNAPAQLPAMALTEYIVKRPPDGAWVTCWAKHSRNRQGSHWIELSEQEESWRGKSETALVDVDTDLGRRLATVLQDGRAHQLTLAIKPRHDITVNLFGNEREEEASTILAAQSASPP